MMEYILARWEGPYNDAKDDAEVYCGRCDENLDDGYENWTFCPSCGCKIIWHEGPKLKLKCVSNTDAALTVGKVYEGEILPNNPNLVDIYYNDLGEEGTYLIGRFEVVE